MQGEDYSWYLDNYNSLYEKYGNAFLVIKDRIVLGSYRSYVEAVNETAKTEPLGTFIVQFCNGKESAYTSYISALGVAY